MLRKIGNLLNNSKRIDKSIRLYKAGKMMNQLENERMILLSAVIY